MLPAAVQMASAAVQMPLDLALAGQVDPAVGQAAPAGQVPTAVEAGPAVLPMGHTHEVAAGQVPPAGPGSLVQPWS